MKTKLPVMIALMVITLFASLAQAQFVQKIDSVYFANATSIKVVNTFTGNATTDTVWTRLKYSLSPTMSNAFLTSYVKDGNAVTKTTKRTVTIAPDTVYYFQVITEIVSGVDTMGNPIVVERDTSKVTPALKKPTLTFVSLAMLQDGFRLSTRATSGNDSAMKTVTIGLDSLFDGSHVLDSIKFNSLNFNSTDSAHGYLSAYYWVKVRIQNKLGFVEKVWKVTKPQLPQGPYITKDSVPTQTTSVSVNLKVVSYTLDTKITVNYGVTTAYGSVVIDTVKGAQGVSILVIGISGLIPGTEYHFGIIAKNAMGSMPLADFTATTKSLPDPNPFGFTLDSLVYILSPTEIRMYGKYKVIDPSLTSVYAYLGENDSSFNNPMYKIVTLPAGAKSGNLVVSFFGPFNKTKYFGEILGSELTAGYSGISNILSVEIFQIQGIDELTKPLDFNGQYQLYDMYSRIVGGGSIERGEMFSLKLRELSLSPGIYVYRIRSDKDQRVLSGKIGRW